MHKPYTPEELAASALVAVGVNPYLPRTGDVAHAVAFVVNATLEEYEDKSPEDLRLVLESLLVITEINRYPVED